MQIIKDDVILNITSSLNQVKFYLELSETMREKGAMRNEKEGLLRVEVEDCRG